MGRKEKFVLGGRMCWGKDVLRRWAGKKSLCWGEGCIEGKDVLRRWAGKKSLC